MTEQHTPDADASPGGRRALLLGAAAGAAGLAAAGWASAEAATGERPSAGAAPAPTCTPGPSPTVSPTASPSPTPTGSPTGAPVVKAGEVPLGGGVIVSSQQLVVTQPAEGEYRAFSNICTHEGCPVYGVEERLIICTCHGSKFAIEDGTVKAGPARQPLPETKVKRVGDDIVRA